MRTDDRTAAFANFVSGENSLCTTVSMSRFHIVSRGVEIEGMSRSVHDLRSCLFWISNLLHGARPQSVVSEKLLKTWEALSFYLYMFPFIYIRFLFIYIWHRVFGLKGKLVLAEITKNALDSLGFGRTCDMTWESSYISDVRTHQRTNTSLILISASGRVSVGSCRLFNIGVFTGLLSTIPCVLE